MGTQELGRVRPSRRRGPWTLLFVAGAAILGAACFPVAPPVPTYPGLGGVISPASGGGCKKVLVAGDSLADQMGQPLQSELAASGRCATVVSGGVAGESVGDWVPGGRSDLGVQLDADRPDLVVIELLGNEGFAGPTWNDPHYLADAAADANAITQAATSRGIPIYWVVPPIAAWNCDFSALSAQRFLQWERWLVANGPTLGGNPLIDWRHPFGGETYSAAFQFPDGIHTVRFPDCVHFDNGGYGQRIAADAVVLTIQGAWNTSGATPLTTIPTTTTTTTTTPTSPTTTTTTPGATGPTSPTS